MNPKSICPEHGPMPRTETKYGGRYGCNAPHCTVVCWDSETSLPGNQEVRDLRHACHKAFDPLWTKGHDWKRFKNRKEAYRWLCNLLQVEPAKAHIGMLNATQCRTLLSVIGSLTPSPKETV